MVAPGHRRYVITVVLILLGIGLGASMLRRAHKGSSDYPMGIEYSRALVFEGENVYETRSAGGTHTKYPPLFFLFVAPIAALPFDLGALLWYAGCVLALVFASRWAVMAMRPEDAEDPPLHQVLLPPALTALLVITNLSIGQVNLVILVLICAALRLAKTQGLIAGFHLGAATALKLTPAFLLAGFAWKRAWALVGGAFAVLVLLWVVLPALVFGPARAAEVTESWGRVVTGFVAEGAAAEDVMGGGIGYRNTNQSLSAALHRTLTDVPAITPIEGKREAFYANVVSLDPKVADVAWLAISALLVLGLLRLARTRLRDTDPLSLGLEMGLAVIVMVVIAPISWDTHFVVVLLPYAAALEALRRPETDDRTRKVLTAAIWISFALITAGVAPMARALSVPLLGTLVLGAALAYARERRRHSQRGSTSSR